MSQQNWFNTLNDALEAESLVAKWPLGVNIGYDQTARVIQDGLCIVVCRDERGMYERPIHYSSSADNAVIIH